MFVGACVCVGLVYAFNSVNYYRNVECEIVPSFFSKTKVVCVKTCCLLGSTGHEVVYVFVFMSS